MLPQTVLLRLHPATSAEYLHLRASVQAGDQAVTRRGFVRCRRVASYRGIADDAVRGPGARGRAGSILDSVDG